ncbi:MAG: right-handed parallel beta-helix repeat-containing protein, partial [Candidatus Aenigmatarchaeota archaeon]
MIKIMIILISLFFLFQVAISIDIYSCQNITSSGYYQLANDVSTIGTCFNITASNVELDCNWKRIDYAQSTSGYGFSIAKVNNITIKNCNLFGGNYDSSHGFYLFMSNYTQIMSSNITTSGSDGYGIYLSSSNNNTISSNNITTSGDYGYGIHLSSSNNNTISSNITTSGSDGCGIHLSSSNNNTISSNITINGVFGCGIHLS